MNFEDILIDDILNIGDECYYEHEKYIYQGKNEEGKHVVKLIKKDSETTKYLVKIPIRPKLPLGIYVKSKSKDEYGEVTQYVHMLDKMYYRVRLYGNVFKDDDLETFDKLKKEWELLEKSPYLEEEVLSEELEKVDEQLRPFQKEIKQLKEQIKNIEQENIKPLELQKEGIFKKCKHIWDKSEEYEVSKGTFEQECMCEICGCTKINRYWKVF